MNDQQKEFVKQYLLLGVATQAAEASGYSKSSAKHLMKNPKIQDAIAQSQMERAEKLGIDKEIILQELVELLAVAKAEVKPKRSSKTGKAIKDPETGQPIYTRDNKLILDILKQMGQHIGVRAWDKEAAAINVHVTEAIREINSGLEDGSVYVQTLTDEEILDKAAEKGVGSLRPMDQDRYNELKSKAN